MLGSSKISGCCCWRLPLVVVCPCLDDVVKGREIKVSASAGVASRPFLHAAAMRASSAINIPVACQHTAETM